MLKNKKNLLLMSVATILASAPVVSVSAAEPLGKCVGANSCKGQGACATSSSSCAGQNSCKGTGWIKTTAKDCAAKGGKISK